MNIFSIGKTNFEIDFSKSKIDFDVQDNVARKLSINIHGSKDIFMRLSEPDDAEWSWALYPPSFFLRGVVVKDIEQSEVKSCDIGDNIEDLELGIYMMEYSDLSEVKILELSTKRLVISGKVDFWGESLPFEIDMLRQD